MKKFFSLLFLLQSIICISSPEISKLFSILNIDIKENNTWVKQLNEWGALSQPKHELPQSKGLPLFSYYPPLQKLAHVSLCELPTPVQKLENISNLLHSNLYIKRDDLSRGSKYGGNKPRKLEFELAQALTYGATCVITFGCAGSNHALATSSCAQELGLQSMCMLKPQANSRVVQKNLLLHLLNGTELHYATCNDIRKIETIITWLEYKNKYGTYPYIIPTGGSTPRGAVGFVNAVFELKQQIESGHMPEPDYIYLPCGSTATTVGLLLGCKAAGLKTKIVAVAVEPEEQPGTFIDHITSLYNATNALLHEYDNSFALFELNHDDLELNLNCAGNEYAVFTPECVQARTLLKETENIIIDGTYTAKAYAALIADAHSHKFDNKVVLFWNTYCAHEFEDRLAQNDYTKLPTCFHSYFEEDVQELDKI